MQSFKPGTQLSKMLLLAVKGHDGQFDKGGRPYILHPLAVMHKMRTDDEIDQCVAVGHDLFEDGKVDGVRVTKQMMRDLGVVEEIIEGIWCMTKLPGETEEEYQEKVLNNRRARKAKKFDLTHNSDLRRLKGVTDKDAARQIKYARFYQRIVERDEEDHRRETTERANQVEQMMQSRRPQQEQQA